MTREKEEAYELFNKFYNNVTTNVNHRLKNNELKTDLVPICQQASKQCAIISIEDKIKLLNTMAEMTNDEFHKGWFYTEIERQEKIKNILNILKL